MNSKKVKRVEFKTVEALVKAIDTSEFDEFDEIIVNINSIGGMA